MSHNVLLSGIKFQNMETLKKAFDELKRDQPEARHYTFSDQPTTVRGWLGRQTRVDAAILCPGHKYDIGFVRGGDGVLTPLMEDAFMAPGLHTQPTAKTVEGEACPYGHEHRALGMLQQRYAVITAEDNARRQGMVVQRVAAADGVVQLEVVQR